MMTMRFAGAFALVLCMRGTSAQAALIKPTELLRDPSSEDWMLLNRFDGTLTREQFEERLLRMFSSLAIELSRSVDCGCPMSALSFLKFFPGARI